MTKLIIVYEVKTYYVDQQSYSAIKEHWQTQDR